MKMKQEFKDIKQPEYIDQEEINTYLREPYGEDKFDINDPRYNTENRDFSANWDSFIYKQQVDKIITEVIRLSELTDFEHLRRHYVRPISTGESRLAADEEKTFIERVCFKLAKRREKVNFVKFKEEVEAATLSKCIGGAARNMQMIFFSMEQAEYYQKYNFISHIALEYIRNKKLVSSVNEPHAVNNLIHEVSSTYNIVPPRDNHTIYRNLEEPVPSNMIRYAEFYPYLDILMDTREGVYSYVSFLANGLMSAFPTAEDLNMVEEGVSIGEDTSSKSILRINDLLREAGIESMQILDEDSEGNYIYKDSYHELIEVIMMQKLIDSHMIDSFPIRSADEELIGTPSAWYLVSRNEANIEYRKILDTKVLQGVTKDGRHIEDYLHDLAKTMDINDLTNFGDKLIRSLFLRSDQGEKTLQFVAKDYLSSLPNDEFKEWINFSKELMHGSSVAMNYIAKHGNIAMYDGACNRVPLTHRDSFSSIFMQKILQFGNNSLFQAWAERDGAKLTQIDKRGSSLLNTAIYNGNVDAAVILINLGANINVTSVENAVLNDSHAIISHMFAHNTELANIINNRTGSIFDSCRSNGDSSDKTYKALLTNGVSPYALHSSTLSEFMVQCQNVGKNGANIKRLKILLDMGFDPKKECDHLIQSPRRIIYHSALDYCKQTGNIRVANLMLKAKAINKSDLEFDCFNQEKIDAPFDAGRTCLQFASNKGFGIKTLIESGANLNIVSKTVGTAMHYAVNSGNHVALQQLIAAGADCSVFGKQGNPVLHYAIKSSSVKSVKILLESVDPNLKNEAGQNALEYFNSLEDKQKKSSLGKRVKRLLEAKALEMNPQMIEVDISMVESFEQEEKEYSVAAALNASRSSAQEIKMSVDTDMELPSSWQERVNKRQASAEEEKEDHNPKRPRGDSFAKRVKNNQNNKEREF
jgi:ankyrin repeat protein